MPLFAALLGLSAHPGPAAAQPPLLECRELDAEMCVAQSPSARDGADEEAAKEDGDAAAVRRDAVGPTSRPLAPKKSAWEAAVGGRDEARRRIRARLAGWPGQLLVDRETLPSDDRAFLQRVAHDTWIGLSAFRDRENGLPVDHVRFRGGVDPAAAEVGDYASISSVGLYLVAIVGAHELGFVSEEEAEQRVRQLLDTLAELETWRGIFFNFYDTTSLERTSHFLSFVDSAWLTAGLMVVRSTFPELREAAARLITQRNYGFFYDAAAQQMRHGYFVDALERSPYHYATLYTEARLGSLIAIGKGDVPEEHWFRMARTFPADDGRQWQAPLGRHPKEVRGVELEGGAFEWHGIRFVPSWGGSMFEAMMPTLLVDEVRFAPRSLGQNGAAHVEVQRRYALEELGVPVWGMSPSGSPSPNGYAEYGVRPLAVAGYPSTAVTPHAAALALGFAPQAATANLRRLVELYPIYGEYGFYDSVDPRSGAVGEVYLALDQSMLFVALVNHLTGGVIQERFAADPIAARALPLLADEDFFD
jgi:hypothetical protein